MELASIVVGLNALFGVDRLSRDDWGVAFAHAYGEEDERWREVLEPAFVERWAGLAVAGAPTVDRVVTCVFPGDGLIAQLEPQTLVFAEHPLDYSERGGFAPVDHELLHAHGS